MPAVVNSVFIQISAAACKSKLTTMNTINATVVFVVMINIFNSPGRNIGPIDCIQKTMVNLNDMYMRILTRLSGERPKSAAYNLAI